MVVIAEISLPAVIGGVIDAALARLQVDRSCTAFHSGERAGRTHIERGRFPIEKSRAGNSSQRVHGYPALDFRLFRKLQEGVLLRHVIGAPCGIAFPCPSLRNAADVENAAVGYGRLLPHLCELENFRGNVAVAGREGFLFVLLFLCFRGLFFFLFQSKAVS